ncbi:MAG TPA: RagB/SusD family nutrient uptake outer membrane protein, partial [Flavisolibacter sp.]|nr:RagB/SusD family nutrient uptake outer membrane protein [Flavisolibacter sp.]
MTIMKKNSILVITALALLALLNSCSKQLDLAPVSSISDANFWQTPEQVDAFVSGLHNRFRSHTSAFQYLGEMRADVFGTDPGSSSVFTGEATQGVERLWTNNLDLDNPGVSNYGGFYSNINQLNLLIAKLNEGVAVSPANKNYYLGIAYGMRAYYYFHMYRSWGKTIIQTEPTTSIDISTLAKPASSEEDVMKLIKEDIDKSVAAFGNDYSFRNQKSWWSKAATQMLKAEVYLWTSYKGGGTADATMAKNALTDIQTNVPALTLLPSFANVFASGNKGNAEIIFAI